MAAFLAGIILVLVALALLLVQLFSYRAGKKTLSWPATQGTISQSTLATTTSVNQRPTNAASSLRAPGMTIGGTTTTLSRTYQADIRYGYAVAGQQYEGNRVSMANAQSNSRLRAKQLVSQFPQGASVTVYYDPQHPIDAVLQPGASVSALLIVFCAAFLGIGVYLLF